MRRQGHRILTRERRRRIDALHRVYEAVAVQGALAAPLGMKFSAPATWGQPDRLTLDLYLSRAMGRLRSGKPRREELGQAKDRAIEVTPYDPNPVVRAAFGAERIAVEALQGLAFDQFCPPCFVGGEAYQSYMDPYGEHHFGPVDPRRWACLLPADVAMIRGLAVSLACAQRSGIVRATWAPKCPTTMTTADPMRPPMEAMALVAQVVKLETGKAIIDLLEPEPVTFPAVLCIGMGFAAAVQGLSALLPGRRVYHLPVPYLLPYDLPARSWQAVVLNVSSIHALAVADLLGQRRDRTHVQQRAILAGQARDVEPVGCAHLVDLVKLADQNRLPGGLLVVMGDPQTYYMVANALVSTGAATPVGMNERITWVDYAPGKAPWAPYGIPRPTGKLVSAWRWTR